MPAEQRIDNNHCINSDLQNASLLPHNVEVGLCWALVHANVWLRLLRCW